MRSTRAKNAPETLRQHYVDFAPIWSCFKWGLPCPFSSLKKAVRSYRTFSPLPLSKAVFFLLHFPSSHLGWTLSSTLFLWSPDFPLYLLNTAMTWLSFLSAYYHTHAPPKQLWNNEHTACRHKRHSMGTSAFKSTQQIHKKTERKNSFVLQKQKNDCFFCLNKISC